MIAPKKRPNRHESIKVDFRNDCGLFHVIINYDNEGKISVLEFKSGKTGGCINTHLKKLSRMANLALKYHAPISEIIEILSGDHCPVSINCHAEMAKIVGDGVVQCEK